MEEGRSTSRLWRGQLTKFHRRVGFGMGLHSREGGVLGPARTRVVVAAIAVLLLGGAWWTLGPYGDGGAILVGHSPESGSPVGEGLRADPTPPLPREGAAAMEDWGPSVGTARPSAFVVL